MPVPRSPRPPQVLPGEPLAFTRELTRRKEWPPTRIKRRHGDAPPAMPFIVVQADSADDGTRPIDPQRAVHSTAIEVLDAAGALVEYPVPGTTYSLRVSVRNRGPAAAFAGVAEFFVGDEAFGVEGFVAPPESSVTVTCRRGWTPADPAAAAAAVVVCAYDALLDRPVKRFAPSEDRHVGQRDMLADFSGTWNGLAFFANAPRGRGLLYRVVVDQDGPAVDVSIFEEVGAPPPTPGPRPVLASPPTLTAPGIASPLPTTTLPAQPQLSGKSTVVGNRVDLSLVGLNFTPPVPFTNDEVTLTLTDPDTMHITQHETFVDPTDPRGPIDLVADLRR
jgi:hypothetical protein